MRVYDMKATCNKIFELANKQGITKSDLARSIGITNQAVNKWNQAINSPSIDNLVIISELFETSLDDLVQRCERI